MFIVQLLVRLIQSDKHFARNPCSTDLLWVQKL